MKDAIAHQDAVSCDRPCLAERKFNLSSHRPKSWSATPEQHGVNGEPDLVDQSGLQQSRSDFAATHHENVAAKLASDGPHELRGLITNELSISPLRQVLEG